MASYAHQKEIVNISVDKIKHQPNTSDQFMQPFNWQPMDIPFYILSGNEYKLYMYILKWAGKGNYFFSPADIAKRLNFKEDTSRKAFKTLTEYGYLTQIANNKYAFDCYPDKAIEIYNQKWMEDNGPAAEPV